jgi:uncharacterized protein YecA (UPF0149 family)
MLFQNAIVIIFFISRHGLLMAVEELLRGGIVELEDGLQTFKREAEAEKAALTASETDLEAQRVNVKRAMGGGQVGERPPKALADEFKAKALPETVDAIEMAIAELIHQVQREEICAFLCNVRNRTYD